MAPSTWAAATAGPAMPDRRPKASPASLPGHKGEAEDVKTMHLVMQQAPPSASCKWPAEDSLCADLR